METIKVSALPITSHAAVRMAQRGIRSTDAELILLIGTEVDDGYFVRQKDFQEVETKLKALLQRLRRLVGKRLIVSNGHVVTAYHASAPYRRKLLRSARETDLYD